MNESEVNLAAILNVFTSWEYADHFEGGTLDSRALRVERYPGFGDTKILGQSWNQGDMFNSERTVCLCF